MSRLLYGFLLGPIMLAILLCGISSFFYNLGSPNGIQDWVRVMVPTVAIAAGIAYAEVTVFGIPCYFYLKKYNRLSLRSILLCAFIIGALSGMLSVYMNMAFTPLADAFATMLFAGIFCGICALPVAFTIWYVGIRSGIPHGRS